MARPILGRLRNDRVWALLDHSPDLRSEGDIDDRVETLAAALTEVFAGGRTEADSPALFRIVPRIRKPMIGGIVMRLVHSVGTHGPGKTFFRDECYVEPTVARRPSVRRRWNRGFEHEHSASVI